MGQGACHRPNKRFSYGRATLQSYPLYNAATEKPKLEWGSGEPYAKSYSRKKMGQEWWVNPM